MNEIPSRQEVESVSEKDTAGFPIGPPVPIPIPPYLKSSGLYEFKWRFNLQPIPLPIQPLPIQPLPINSPLSPAGNLPHSDVASPKEAAGIWPGWWFRKEELRLDVDGNYPQMTASGTVFNGLGLRVHWIANLGNAGLNRWTGNIWYKHGNASAFPHGIVTIKTKPSLWPSQQMATATFSGGSARPRTVTYKYKSPYFHRVEVEIDTASNAQAVTTIDSHGHPNRPATLPKENLSITKVYRRAGFDVARSGDSIVPLGSAGPDERWSDAEMHDAMQIHWSRFADKPQWALWVFFAALHESGTGLGGIMFDDIGPNHRQGTAIFTDSFISQPPNGESNPAAWVKRMTFWTAVHEMGHAFNLAHSWQKAHPPSWGSPWIPLTNDTQARSFMNYPFRVSGGQSAFFSDFHFRFIDEELLFMRHAPAQFVQMGNADWFDHHGFEQAETWHEPTFALEVRLNRSRPVFEFLEPVRIELKLKNISGEAQLVDDGILKGGHEMTLVIKKDGKPTREWIPYATYCRREAAITIQPNESVYESLFVSAGINGWDLAEPGYYTIQVAIRRGDEDLVSNRLRIRIQPSHGFDEEDIAQDFFSEDVGRVLAFDGSLALSRANETLQETVERISEKRVTVHARMALGSLGMRPFKLLSYDSEDKPAVDIRESKADETIEMLSPMLAKQPEEAIETLGHIGFKRYVDRYSEFLSEQDSKSEAAKTQRTLHDVLEGRGVLKKVLDGIKKTQKEFEQ